MWIVPRNRYWIWKKREKCIQTNRIVGILLHISNGGQSNKHCNRVVNFDITAWHEKPVCLCISKFEYFLIIVCVLSTINLERSSFFLPYLYCLKSKQQLMWFVSACAQSEYTIVILLASQRRCPRRCAQRILRFTISQFVVILYLSASLNFYKHKIWIFLTVSHALLE